MFLDKDSVRSAQSDVALPTYDRSEVTTGIVHFGVGGFHRAHQAMYIDELLNLGLAREWGICGVGVMPSDTAMRDVLTEQDGLYSLTLKHNDGSVQTRVIGSIVEYLYAPDDPEAVIAKLAAPTTRIVSLTITEGGYNIEHDSGEFDLTQPAVAADLQPGAVPTTSFGLICAALDRRRQAGIAPFTIMSCDNIEGNGHIAQRAFSGFAAAKDPELGAWVAENAAFPSSMVDRITPVTTPEAVTEVAELLGLQDRWPVVAEPFTSWVLEDNFTMGRPPLEKVDVQVVADVRPYELMKLRLLNASHQALCYFGYLAGYRLVHDACQDPLLSGFLLDYMNNEATPTLGPVPGINLDEYKQTLIERFSNPAIGDTIARLCAESSDRIPKWVLPVIREQLESGGSIERATAVVASWARYAEGVDEQGEPITVVDQLADQLVPIARSQRENPLAFVENTAVFGDLASNERFAKTYLAALDSLHTAGARATLESLARQSV